MSELEKKAEEIINDIVIFWKDGFDGECVTIDNEPFINPICNQIMKLTDKGLTPTGIVLDGTTTIKFIVAKDEGFDTYLKEQQEKKEKKSLIIM